MSAAAASAAMTTSAIDTRSLGGPETTPRDEARCGWVCLCEERSCERPAFRYRFRSNQEAAMRLGRRSIRVVELALIAFAAALPVMAAAVQFWR